MSIERLNNLRNANDQAGREMADERARYVRLARRHLDGTAPRVIVADQLYETPRPIAARMAAMVAAHVGDRPARILEPSAGTGRLYVAGRQAMPLASWVLVEVAPDCCAELYRLTENADNATLRQGDFLTMQAGGFDAVIMNPPFRRGLDVRHIRHAVSMLSPGGLLVSLCYDGSAQARHLRPICDTWEPLPANSFRESGTDAGVVLLTIYRPVYTND